MAVNSSRSIVVDIADTFVLVMLFALSLQNMSVKLARSIVIDEANTFYLDNPRLLVFAFNRWLFNGLCLLFA